MGIEGKKHQDKLKIIGQKIQKFRKKKAYTQQALAEELGITRVYMGYIEQGRESPSLSLMFRLADILGVKLNVLLDYSKK